jgi:hypothetical protein
MSLTAFLIFHQHPAYTKHARKRTDYHLDRFHSNEELLRGVPGSSFILMKKQKGMRHSFCLWATLVCFILAMLLCSRPSFVNHLVMGSSPITASEPTASSWCLNNRKRNVKWAREDMKRAVYDFIPIYNKRPLGRKQGGMQFDHSFGLWFMLSRLRPSFVVESGAFEGHTTWIIRQACPEAQIISLDPAEPKARFDGVTYFNLENFTDFNSIDWGNYKVDPANSLVLFDDHRSLGAIQIPAQRLVPSLQRPLLLGPSNLGVRFG